MSRHDTPKSDAREGDILGLGNAGNATHHDPLNASDETARRHRRMNEGADELTPDTASAPEHGSGATSIDMGAGGDGTDIE
jgi:hypothetical protein